MRVSSFMRQSAGLVPIEIELALAPGLPQFTFLGLPDAALRESAVRIRAALREQGFKLPKAKQILVQLRPNNIRKSSKGLDLAVAAAYLWESAQIPKPDVEIPCLYGELTLKGDVLAPDDVEEIELNNGSSLYTGYRERPLAFPSYQLNRLNDFLRSPNSNFRRVAALGEDLWRRPLAKAQAFTAAPAHLAEIVAAGEHSVLVAGPQGSGKTTLLSSVPAWIEEPREDAIQKARLSTLWRPVQQPHHTATPLAMIGGGAKASLGEITRAHGGVLLLDELLEFRSEVQEALREPVETGEITVIRAGVSQTHPSRFLLLATTNLCACGKFVPGGGVAAQSCICSSRVRRRKLGRLTGPFLDRFALVDFSHEWGAVGEGSRDSSDIQARVANAIEFRKERGGLAPNAYADAAILEASLTEFQRDTLLSDIRRVSRRRLIAVLRVARTIADLDARIAISSEDLDEAIRFAYRRHELLAMSDG